MKSSNEWKRLENSGSKFNDSGQRPCNWLQLHDHGLEAVRVLLDSQDQEVCQEFVEHWDFKSRTTIVHGTKIDLSLNNVLDVSGFRSQWSTKVLDRSKLKSLSTATRCTAIFPVQGDNWSNAPIASCKDDLVRDLLVLLSKTLWFPCMRQPSRAPRELIYLVLEALDGAELNWAKCVYTKFLAELKRLQIRRGSFYDQIRTLAGPFMYFLYTHAKCKPRAFSEVVQYHTKGPVTRVQRVHKAMILDREESTTNDKVARLRTNLKSDDQLGLVPAASTVQAPKSPPKTPCLPTRQNKRRRPVCGSSELSRTVTVTNDQPFTPSTALESTTGVEQLQVSTTRADHEDLSNEIAQKNEEILRLQLADIESRLNAEKMERLYLEEQKHVQQCMKLHFEAVEAEEEVADLKAKVNALQDEKRELRDEKRELQKKERFLELQLADMRRRWETAAIRVELAEIQAAEKSCLLLRQLHDHPTGK